MVLAWVLRDFAKPLIQKIPWIVHQATGEISDKWYGQQAVYRLSMGNFMFFALMSAVLVGVKYKSDKRDQYLHHGGWLVKLALWLAFCILPFFFPVGLVNAYSWLARFGSGLFMVVQMIILLDMTQNWNDDWVSKEDERFLYALLAVTIGAFAGAIALIAVSFYWFNPSGAGDCSFNIFVMAVTILLTLAVSLGSLHPQAQNGSLFPSAVVSLYCSYLCYSALQSEPHSYQCNGLGKHFTAASGSTLAVGMVIAIVSVVYSALRAGSNNRTFMAAREEAVEEGLLETETDGTSAGLDGEPTGQSMARGRQEGKAMDEFELVTYSYSFFHLIFALASMYIAMLMTGWGTGAEERDLIDVGWTSVWVKVIAQWMTVAVYAWTMAAPLLFPDRDFS